MLTVLELKQYIHRILNMVFVKWTSVYHLIRLVHVPIMCKVMYDKCTYVQAYILA